MEKMDESQESADALSIATTSLISLASSPCLHLADSNFSGLEEGSEGDSISVPATTRRRVRGMFCYASLTVYIG